MLIVEILFIRIIMVSKNAVQNDDKLQNVQWRVY